MSSAIRILVTEPIMDEVIDYLEQYGSVTVGERGTFDDEASLKKALPKYDAALTMLSNPVTRAVLESNPDISIIANHAVGYDNIDIEAAQELAVPIANTPGVLTDASADGTLALLLATVRRIPEAQQFLREGKFDGWHPQGFLGMELRYCTLGIYGMGRIGTAVARRAKAFGMKVIYHNRNRVDPDIEEELEATFVPTLEELAERSDILSVHCPQTPETHHSIDADLLRKLGSEGVLINTARGPIVDEAALAEALHEGTIRAAGLDVFEKEPEVHPKLLSAPNSILEPHIVSATYHTRKAMGMLAAEAIIKTLEGTPLDQINNLLTHG
jgi:glyoxylate reductase